MLVRGQGRAPVDARSKLRRFSQAQRVGPDGVQVAYYFTEPPRAGAPVVVIARSLGGSTHAWGPLAAYLGDRYQLVTWDYRGLFGSLAPSGSGHENFAIANHVDDLESVLGALGVTEAGLVGSGMGADVCMQACARRPAAARALVLLNATVRPTRDPASPAWASRLVPPAFSLLERFAAPAGALMRRAASGPACARWAKRLGAVAETADDGSLGQMIEAFAHLDIESLALNLRALREHDVGSLLGRIDVPTLVITGDRDRVAPRALAQQMARRLPRAETLVVRGGGHLVEAELPELVGLRIERFFGEHFTWLAP